MKADWDQVILSGAIHELAPLCINLTELAEGLSERLGEAVNENSLRKAWDRRRDKMRLPMLGDMLGEKTDPCISSFAAFSGSRNPSVGEISSTWQRPEWEQSATPEANYLQPSTSGGSSFRTVVVIPDTQNKPGVPTDHLVWAGRLIQDVWPDYIVELGDWWDFPSLSKYTSKRGAEGRRVRADLDAGNRADDVFSEALGAWIGRKVRLRGNHENRLQRYIDDNPELDTFMTDAEFRDADHGWEVVPFLQPIELDGIRYCHYFPRSASGRVLQDRRGASNARLQVQREQISCTAGHMQGLDYYQFPNGDTIRHSLIAGSFYQHDEDYLTPQGNHHWRGVVVKRHVRDGQYDPEFISMEQLRAKYG